MGFPPAAQPVLFALILLFGAYLLFEAWRWYAGNSAQLTPGQFRRRMVGGFLLEADLLLWLLANPLMAGRPARERLLYLLVATLLVFIPMLLAVREAAFIMRQYARWRGELARNLGRRDPPGSAGGSNPV
jgi:hypothetical protein